MLLFLVSFVCLYYESNADAFLKVGNPYIIKGGELFAGQAHTKRTTFSSQLSPPISLGGWLLNSRASISTHAGIAVLIKNNSASGISACFLYLFCLLVSILVSDFENYFFFFCVPFLVTSPIGSLLVNIGETP